MKNNLTVVLDGKMTLSKHNSGVLTTPERRLVDRPDVNLMFALNKVGRIARRISEGGNPRRFSRAPLEAVANHFGRAVREVLERGDLNLSFLIDSPGGNVEVGRRYKETLANAGFMNIQRTAYVGSGASSAAFDLLLGNFDSVVVAYDSFLMSHPQRIANSTRVRGAAGLRDAFRAEVRPDLERLCREERLPELKDRLEKAETDEEIEDDRQFRMSGLDFEGFGFGRAVTDTIELASEYSANTGVVIPWRKLDDPVAQFFLKTFIKEQIKKMKSMLIEKISITKKSECRIHLAPNGKVGLAALLDALENRGVAQSIEAALKENSLPALSVAFV